MAMTSTSLRRWTAIHRSCPLLLTLDLKLVVRAALDALPDTGLQTTLIRLRVAVLGRSRRAGVDQPVVDALRVLTMLGRLALGCLWERTVAVRLAVLPQGDGSRLREPHRRLATGAVALHGHALELEVQVQEPEVLQERLAQPPFVAILLRIEQLLQRDAALHLGVVATLRGEPDEDGLHPEGREDALLVVGAELDEAHVALGDLAQ